VSDLLVRDVADRTVAEIDRRAREQGLSRAEYLRRRLNVEYQPAPEAAVTDADWRRFQQATADLDDPEVMARAWA
jgi:phage terminase large subunit-like protein